MTEIEHGTYSGWNKHQRDGVPTTEECGCNAARNEYMRVFRLEHPESVARARMQTKARNRALAILAQRHAVEYAHLLAEALKKIESTKS